MTTREERFRDYFSSINPIARKIINDQEQVKSKYGDAWQTLSIHEQDEIINNNLINAHGKQCGDDGSPTTPYPPSFPKLVLSTGNRVVVDVADCAEDSNSKATGLTWRDEHSTPFSWETMSQMNLRVAGESDSGYKQPANRSEILDMDLDSWHLEDTVLAKKDNPGKLAVSEDLLGQISMSFSKPPPNLAEETDAGRKRVAEYQPSFNRPSKPPPPRPKEAAPPCPDRNKKPGSKSAKNSHKAAPDPVSAFTGGSLFSYVNRDDSSDNVSEVSDTQTQQECPVADEIWNEPLAGFSRQSSTQDTKSGFDFLDNW
ncbi:PREDICTED: uncharacterized protein C1orf198 homolog isoform X2 [Priapulus caudatus]|nr:PREDICTED: uncharacterized protein C1orf198 homolog isoform X2 [Priapulus caudatus]